MKILVTGGLGFIGSHTSVELINKGYDVTIIDNLVNSNISVLKNIEKITGVRPEFHKIDLRNKNELKKKFRSNIFNGVIHFAALKSVSESVKNPELYLTNNVEATKNLLDFIASKGKKTNLIFSSSCTVYGQAKKLPINESSPVVKQESPYGESKKICEEIIRNEIVINKNINGISLRYFNPIGAHESSLIGELPKGIPENLVPYITQSAIGKIKELIIFGNDYPTIDGTCIRDYIHIKDLVNAHVSALEFLSKMKKENFYDFFNVGTGRGITVLELIKIFEDTNNIKLNYKIGNRRAGDIIAAYADIKKINTTIGWYAQNTISDALKTAWNWEKQLSKLNDN